MVSKTAVWKWIVNEDKNLPGNVRCSFCGYILDRKVAAETEMNIEYVVDGSLEITMMFTRVR